MLKSQISAMTFSKVSSTKWKNRLGKGLTKKNEKKSFKKHVVYSKYVIKFCSLIL